MSDVEFFGSARGAVVRYVREIALLPSFSSDAPISETVEPAARIEGVQGPVLRVVATSKVNGQVLPRTEDAWIAMRPFQDITKSMLDAWKTALLERRMAVLELLVRLSASEHFGWNAMMNCGGQLPPSSMQSDPKRSFWLELLRELSSDVAHDRSMDLERNLVALSRSPSPRVLLCVDSDPSQVDFADLLDQFLWANKTNVVRAQGGKNALDEVLETCRLTPGPISRRTIEIGLSFTTGKITQQMIAKLCDVLEKLTSSECRGDGIQFRIVALRFGVGCAVQPTALEVLADRWSPAYPIADLILGAINGVRPASVQECLTTLTSEKAIKINRLAVDADEDFPAVASAFRVPTTNTIAEVNIGYNPTEENAAWLAFAFFHADSASTVSSICLRVSQENSFFSAEWVQAFERALRSHTACEELTGEKAEEVCEDNQIRKRFFVTIKAMTPAKSHPYSGAKLLCKLGTADGDGQEFEMIAKVKKLIGVVVPGIGVGWVPEASVVSTRITASRITMSENSQTNQRVTSLSIDRKGKAALRVMREQHIATMLQLLALVGAPLRCLQLPDCVFEQEHLAQILRLCPNLEELNVSGHLFTNIQPLVDAYLSDACKISTLSISNSFSPTNEDDIAEQLAGLLRQKPNICLRRLMMHLIGEHAIGLLAPKCSHRVAQDLATALSERTQLEFVQLTTLTPSTIGLKLQLNPLELDFTGSLVSERLSAERTLAFLSVVHENSHQNKSPSQSVWRRLDAHVLAQVLTFCRTAVARHVLRCN